jgi:EAL domain-containing protein (putative c-di-GMP-specific phosphodiesterase class I)
MASIFSNLRRDDDDAWVADYGPYTLHSALQPIFSQDHKGVLTLQAFEGLIRPARNGEFVRPGEFFSGIAAADRAKVDSLCRSLHIFNTGALNRRHAKLFVNFYPGLFVTEMAIRREVEIIKIATIEAGLTPERIACEITQKENDSSDMLSRFVEELRKHGFRIAIDEYGAEERDIARLNLLKPDYVKFEADWVKEFLENSAGSALLRVMVSQFREKGVLAIFEGLEDLRQVDMCQNLDVPLLQGYALARPELAPTHFNADFPDADRPLHNDVRPRVDLERYDPNAHLPRAPAPSFGGGRKVAAFGKRTV